MNFEQTVYSLPLEIIDAFKLALDKGYWESGIKLSNEERDICKTSVDLFNSYRNRTLQ